MKKIIDKIYLILLCIIIVMLNLFIGSNHQEPKTILETIILITGLIYIIVKRIQNKKNIVIKGKIDIFMLLLVIATIIPLLIKNYYSLNDTINFCLEYLCMYVIYILARNLLKSTKEINIVIDITLISSIVIIIFGLDKLYFNKFKDFLELIKSAKSTAYGMTSTIGYSNPLAAYMSLLSFFALGRYLCVENKWIKALFASYIQIALIGFVFGNSRALMLMYPMIFIIYLICLKDNLKRLQSILIIGSNFVIAYIFQAMSNKIITTNLILWISFIIDLTLVYLLSLILNNIAIKVKINKKKMLITSVIISILFTAYVLVVKNIGEPVTLNEKNKMVSLWGLKNNEEYNIKINLTSNISEKIIIENYFRRSTKERFKEVMLQAGEQILEFNIHTEEDFERIGIYRENHEDATNKVVINNIYINNKPYIVSYKYLPNDIIRLIRTLNFRTVSIYERFAFGVDSLKLAKKHLIFGAGGCAFGNHIKPYQSYVHSYNQESHSYILDLLLNYGIFGLLIYITILIITIYNAIKTIKNSKKENNIAQHIAILFGIILFTLHAVIDYDLNYLVTICIYYMFIAIINKDDKNFEKKDKIKIAELSDCVIILTITIGLTLTLPRCFTTYWIEQEEYKKAYTLCNYSEDIKLKILNKAYIENDIETLEEFLPLYTKYEKYKNNFRIYNMYWYVITVNLNQGKTDKATKEIEEFYKYITEQDNISKVDILEIRHKNGVITSIIEKIKENEKFAENEQLMIWYNKLSTIVEGV